MFAVLNGDAALQNLVNGIYDLPPDDAPYPFVTIEDVSADEEAFLGGALMKMQLQLMVYSRYHGKGELHAVLERLHALLHHAELSVSGVSVVQVSVVQSRLDSLRDGRTQRGQMRVEFMVQL